MNTKTLFNLLRSDGCIVVNKTLAKNIGINAAIMYSELLSKYYYFSDNNMLTETGMFFNTIEDIEKDTTLTGYQQRKAIYKLFKLDLIEVQVTGMPARRYFKIMQNMKNVETLLNPSYKETSRQVVKKLDGNNTKNNTKGNI